MVKSSLSPYLYLNWTPAFARTLTWVVAIFFVTPSIAAAQALWLGPSGGGLMSVQEGSTLYPGHFNMGLVFDNYDRDPLGLDLIDVRVDWRLGLTSRFEVYGRHYVGRAVSVPTGTQSVPPSPLDIVSFKPGFLSGPYRPIYWPVPYAGAGPADFREMVAGEFDFGVKGRIVGQRGLRPALAASADIAVPGAPSVYALRQGSGSGTYDIRLNGAGTWDLGRASISANLGYVFARNLKNADQLIIASVVQSGAANWLALDQPIERPGMLSAGVGLRAKLYKGIWALAEYSGWLPVGSRTAVFDEAGASDVLTGIELRARGIAVTAGLRYHTGSPKSGVQKSTGPLAGALDLSGLSYVERRRYLSALGVDPSMLRPEAGLVVVGAPAGVPMPAGNRLIAPFYTINAAHNLGLVGGVSFSF